jgi:hypothetical protein
LKDLTFLQENTNPKKIRPKPIIHLIDKGAPTLMMEILKKIIKLALIAPKLTRIERRGGGGKIKKNYIKLKS